MKKFALGVAAALALLWLGYAGPRQPAPDDYLGYSAVILTAVAVLVTTPGVFIAVLAIAGYRELKRIARDIGASSAVSHVNKELESGTLGKHIDTRVMNFITAKYDDGFLTQIVERRVDQITLGQRRDSAIDDALDDDGHDD